MAATTLVTFLLRTPRHVASVHLYGSWDNFTKSYAMQRDTKLGRGHWRGCHSITDIICDGEDVHPTQKRQGGLLEGGRYWYYYQIDDDVEIHDTRQQSTTTCPFLPGQTVNVLDVPIQHRSQPDNSRDRATSVSSTVYTLDPQDKYRALRPLELRSSSKESPSIDVKSPSTLAAKSRPTTAVQSPTVTNPFVEFPMALSGSHIRPQTVSLPFSCLPTWALNDHLRPYSTGMVPDHWGFEDFVPLTEDLSDDIYPAETLTHCDPQELTCIWTLQQLSLCHRASKKSLMQKPTDSAPNYDESALLQDRHINALLHDETSSDPSRKTPHDRADGEEITSVLEVGLTCTPERGPQESCGLQHSFSVSSSRTSAFFSSITSDSELDDVDPHLRPSQPITPTRPCEFGAELLLTTTSVTPVQQARSIPANSVSGNEVNVDMGLLQQPMNVYQLPATENASALTLQNLETATVKSSHGDTSSVRAGLVEAWNDGSEHRKTGLQELVDDLGYLGSIIG